MCFRCLIFSLSGPCELLFLLGFIAYWTRGVMSVMLYIISLYVLSCSVNGSDCFVCCVSDSVCELFGETIRNMFGRGCYFVVECYGSV